jgi:hypothetical protein
MADQQRTAQQEEKTCNPMMRKRESLTMPASGDQRSGWLESGSRGGAADEKVMMDDSRQIVGLACRVPAVRLPSD